MLDIPLGTESVDKAPLFMELIYSGAETDNK